MAITTRPRRKASPIPSPAAETPAAADAILAAPPAAVANKPAAKKAAAKKAAAKTATAKKATAKEATAKNAAPTKRVGNTPPSPAAEPDLAQAVLTLLTGPAPLPVLTPPPTPAQTAVPPAPPSAATGPAHSAIVLQRGDRHRVAWLPGHACPPALQEAAARHLDGPSPIAPDDDAALPLLLRVAHQAGHRLDVDSAVWPHLAAHRDARTRIAVLANTYPDGPASPGLVHLLRSPLPVFQVEGALFAVVAGRALIADERGLGKSVQAIAAATLWRRHFGVSRVLLLCPAAQRSAWQRAWARFAPDADLPQVVDGGLHLRQAQWSGDAAVRVLSPEALASDAAHLAHWAPELVIVDEPQLLGLRDDDWAALDAPHALVLCGAALADEPALMDAIVNWLDVQRLGPLAALRELRAASDQGRALAEADVERLSADLSRLMLQRQRSDVLGQLPALVHSERGVAMAPGQRDSHDAALAQARRLLARWQRSAYFSDADQWRLALAVRAMRQACHRADPHNPHSALADATVQALAIQLDAWAATGPLQAAVLCATPADLAQLAQRLTLPDGIVLCLADADKPTDLPAGLDAVLHIGVPWQTSRSPAGPRGRASAGQQWLYLVAQDSIDAGLFSTLASRHDAPSGPADAAGKGFLQGERLHAWLMAVQAALPT